MMYTLEELKLEASKLMEGNCKCVHMQQIKEIFERNNMVVVEFDDKYLVFKVEQH